MLREQLAEAHAANRENRRIIAALTQRIPELEAPSEPREAPVTASGDRGVKRTLGAGEALRASLA